ncbi:flagellar biosynthesis regulator FlaF [Cognatishimia sp. F0-27]|uniref:flagellar biosynthesis regulator FlaF n=1 Tax=Cognatishimia sp. F0-27 TaxID=2816855 RepID=UPI001D0C5386|nr:flagellar biosynthesis regulator FlaF [Cognatishimia sp. F0-27]
MNSSSLARQAYGQAVQTTRTDRSTEYLLIAKVTHRIKASAEAGALKYSDLVEALSDNQRVWTTLAVDVANENNRLPQELRARIFYLSEFVQVYTRKVLLDGASVRPLLDINSAILRGLSGKGTTR